MLLNFLSICVLLMFSTQVNAKGGPTLSKIDMQKAQTFQSLKGSDRLDAFKKIQTLLLDKYEVAAVSSKMNVTPTTLNDVLALLGNPDAIVADNFYEYYLKNSSSQCKVVLCFDKLNQLVFSAIKNCP